MRAIACALAVLAAATACGGGGLAARPDLQKTLAALVTGPSRVAPGVTAYVSGPRGTWSGAAGLADVSRKETMQAGAPMRLESVSKLWTATVVAKLAAEHKLTLDDTVGKWLPGVFAGSKRAITIRQLLNHTSGLIDNNDLAAAPERWLAAIHDMSLRAQLAATMAALRRDAAYRYPDMLEIRAAAALPLLFDPGANWHYSNIGYKVAGLIAERASGEQLGALYARTIIVPLGLRTAAYDPSGAIPGKHPVGYRMLASGAAMPATSAGAGALGAEGGIVANAEDEARFLVALVEKKIVPTRDLFTTSPVNGAYALGTGVGSHCGKTAYAHEGAGLSWKSAVMVAADGSRVAVVLWNGRLDTPAANDRYAAAVLRLFCGA